VTKFMNDNLTDIISLLRNSNPYYEAYISDYCCLVKFLIR
jgi:hypothetical protein